MVVLAIESSCDETAAAVIVGGEKALSNIVSSQTQVHRKYGGVVPVPIINEAFLRQRCTRKSKKQHTGHYGKYY